MPGSDRGNSVIGSSSGQVLRKNQTTQEGPQSRRRHSGRLTPPGHRRIRTQDGDHFSSAHRPTRLGKDRQQLIREDPVRFRVRLRSHRFCRPGTSPDNTSRAIANRSISGRHASIKPREPRRLQLQPQPLDPAPPLPARPATARSDRRPPAHRHRDPVQPTGSRTPQSLRKKRTRVELQIGVGPFRPASFRRADPYQVVRCGAPRLRSLIICRSVRHGSANTGNAGEPAPA